MEHHDVICCIFNYSYVCGFVCPQGVNCSPKGFRSSISELYATPRGSLYAAYSYMTAHMSGPALFAPSLVVVFALVLATSSRTSRHSSPVRALHSA